MIQPTQSLGQKLMASRTKPALSNFVDITIRVEGIEAPLASVAVPLSMTLAELRQQVGENASRCPYPFTPLPPITSHLAWLTPLSQIYQVDYLPDNFMFLSPSGVCEKKCAYSPSSPPLR